MMLNRQNTHYQTAAAVENNSLALDNTVFVYGVRAERARKRRDGAADSGHQFELKFLDALICISPDKAEAFVNRGVTYLRIGEVQKAISDFTRGIELSQTSAITAVAHSNRGTAFNYIDRYQDAIRDFEASIGFDRHMWHPFLGRGVALTHLGKYQEAIEDFTVGVEMDPANAQCYLERARVYSFNRMNSEAMLDCCRALDLQSNMLDAYVIRAAVLASSEKFTEAIKDLNKAIELDKDFAPAYLVRSKIFHYLGSEQWIVDRQRAFELDNNLDFSP